MSVSAVYGEYRRFSNKEHDYVLECKGLSELYTYDFIEIVKLPVGHFKTC